MSAAHNSPTDSQRDGRPLSVWAFILIAVGIIWLLLQAGVLSGANLVVLFRFWPVILVALGLQLLIGRSSRVFSLIIGAGTVVLLFALMVVGPSIGLAGSARVQNAQYTEPLDGTTSARFDLDFSVGSVNLFALSDSNSLIDADLRYVGEVDFDSSTANGETLVTLTSRNESGHVFDFLGLSLGNTLNDDNLRWEIGLNPAIPLALDLNGGVGTNQLDLSALQLSSLRYAGGIGSSTISLPSGSYDLDLNGGVGALTVNFAADTSVDARIVGGVGRVVLDVPEGAPVRLEVEGTLGGVDVPNGFKEIEGNRDVDESGVWESETYDSAGDTARIRILFDGGVGGLSVE